MSEPEKKRFLTDAEAGSGRAAIKVAKTLYKIPVLLTTWTRCGKANCRCTAGRLHGPYHALHWREGTVQRRRYVKAADVPTVRAILTKRRAARRRERIEQALGLLAWRRLTRHIETYEAHLREQGDHA
ncbi:MAG: hypothetical protein M3464_11005 [Chloroflexota bacterium]|nr:hypothetical protein [Chloroflexota bacterium]